MLVLNLMSADKLDIAINGHTLGKSLSRVATQRSVAIPIALC